MEQEEVKQTVHEKAEERALELQRKLGYFKVHPIVFRDEASGEDIVGFIKEPERIHKQRVMDKAMQGAVTAAADCLKIILIRDASDPRIYSEDQRYDAINMGAVMAVYDLINFSVNTFKKK